MTVINYRSELKQCDNKQHVVINKPNVNVITLTPVNIIERTSYFSNKIIYLTCIFQTETRDEKIKIISKLLDCLDEHSDIVFNNYTNYICFISKLKQKLFEFKEHKELKYKCENFIDTYFNEDCRAFTLKNKKCGNKISLDVSKDFCKAHDKKYVSKIIKIINRVLPLDISRLCANYLFH